MILKRVVYFIQSGEGCRKKRWNMRRFWKPWGRRRGFAALLGVSNGGLQNSDRPLLHASFDEALCLDVFVPVIFRVPIEVIVIHFRLKGWMPVKIVRCFVSA
jgi:hypothetical protein